MEMKSVSKDLPGEESAFTRRRVRAVFYDCPKCGGNRAVPILYGYPDPFLMQEWRGGVVELGGCTIDGVAPNLACRDCRHEWVAPKGVKGREEEVILEPLPPESDEDEEVKF